MKRILGICALALLVAVTSASAATIVPSNYIAMQTSAAASTVWPINFKTSGTGNVVSDVASAILSKSSLLTVPGSPAVSQWSAVGWQNANQYFDFTVNMNGGKGFNASQLYIAGMRSSGTGPGTVTITFSKDGGAFQQLDTFASVTTGYINKLYDVSTLIGTVNSSLDIQISAGGLAMNGGTIGTGGTFRVGDYTADGGLNYTPFGITGAVINTPEPATMAILGLGSLVIARRRRRA
jgi:hypothetical protein